MRDWENNIRKVVPYTPGEQPKNTCVIKLNTNENPYPPAPGVKEVLSNFNTDDLRLFMACRRQQNKVSNRTLDGMRNKKGSDRADCEPDKRESKSCKTAVSSSYPAYHSHNVS